MKLGTQIHDLKSSILDKVPSTKLFDDSIVPCRAAKELIVEVPTENSGQTIICMDDICIVVDVLSSNNAKKNVASAFSSSNGLSW
jgi:hypothetical protein